MKKKKTGMSDGKEEMSTEQVKKGKIHKAARSKVHKRMDNGGQTQLH